MFKYKVLNDQVLSLRFKGNNPHLIPRLGLKDHGPFKPIEHSKLSIRFIYPRKGDLKNVVKRFIQVLMKGERKFLGFEKIYRTKPLFLEEIEVDFQEMLNPSKSRKLKDILMNDVSLSPRPIYIALVPPCPRWFKWSPYYILKAYLLQHNIMSQMIKFDTLTYRPLDEVAFNVSNAIFAKAGGEPWRLWSRIPSFSGTSDKVIIVGTGISRIPKEPGFKEYDRYAGFTILYSDEGQLLYIKTFVTEYDKQAVTKKLNEAIIEAIDSFNVYGELDLIIHYAGKELSHQEEEEIVKTISQIKEMRMLRINYVVLRIIRNPLYRVFSETEHGYPPMGMYVRIGERLLLTYTIGYLQGMRPMGVPIPLLLSIRLSNLSINDVDLEALVASVCEFARLNWRGTNLFNREPVTVKYSRLLAYLASSLKEVGLNTGALPRKKPWFL